jgi:type I restriction enzyme, S subunit
MVKRPRLSAPQEENANWRWHEAKWSSLPASVLWRGDRRMEAENYLAGGYGIRLAMNTRATGRVPLASLARVWQPSRLKGILVSKDYGTPFFAATQVFDLRPTARKFLSLERTDNVNDRMVTPGEILVTCSGSVGRATLAHRAHEKTLISHDLLRVTPHDQKHWGWVYSYLRSPQARAMMGAAQYGHVIKHLETSHLDALPVPMLRDDLLDHFQGQAQRILNYRIKAFDLLQQAERRYEDCFPSLKIQPISSNGFSVKASKMFTTRRRLDASCFVPTVDDIVSAYHLDAKKVEPLSDLTKRIFVPGRFKHVYGDGGMPYLDSADILEVNPDISKFVLSLSEEEQQDYHVEPGWLIIPCSGQVYGNVGHTVLATEWHVGKVLTNHILRVCPNNRVRSGYLQCVLGHPVLGRPQIVRFAFGSSVPEIAAGDVATIPIPRISSKIENELADMMEDAAAARDLADELEQQLAHEAEVLIDKFLSGDTTAFVLP